MPKLSKLVVDNDMNSLTMYLCDVDGVFDLNSKRTTTSSSRKGLAVRFEQ